MPEKVLQSLRDAISDVLETMCFVCPVPLEELAAERLDGCEFLGVEVCFKGGSQGVLRIWFPKELALQLSQNLSGVDSKDMDENQVLDAIKEITNMTAGAILQREDPQGRFSLEIPHPIEIGPAPNLSDGLQETGVAMDVDGHILVAALMWDKA